MGAVTIYGIQALHGLVYGMLLFLIASGLTLVFGMMRIMNIAHAGFYMLGAYLAYTVTALVGNFWISLIVVPVVLGAIGGVIERLLLRRTVRLGHAYQLLLTFGLLYMIGESVLLIWGTYPLEVPIPPVLKGSISIFGGLYPTYRLFILLLSGLIAAAMMLILNYTRVGVVIRSIVADAPMAAALGINVERVRFLVFSAGTALAALAGVIAAPFTQADPLMGGVALLDAFVVVVLGGFGSLLGALLASLLVGQLQSFGVMFAPELASIVQFLLMLIVLTLRPRGLFGDVT